MTEGSLKAQAVLVAATLVALAAEFKQAAIEASDFQWEFAETYSRSRSGFIHGERGQSNLASLFIGLLIAAIIAIQVFIPVVNDAIASSNVSGTTKTILELLGLFAGLLLLVALASPLMRRT